MYERFGETQGGGDNWMSILTSPRLALRIGLPRCSTGSRRKRCARSPQFSPHSPNAALLTHFDSTASFSHFCQLVFFVCSPRREVLRIKGFAKSDLLSCRIFTGEVRVNGRVANYMKAEELFWSGRRDLNSGPPAPKAGVLSFRSPSLAIPHMKIKELSREIVVVGCGWKCLRMHGVPVIFTTAKTTRKQRKCEASVWGRGIASAMPDVSKYGSNSLEKTIARYFSTNSPRSVSVTCGIGRSGTLRR